MLPYWFLYSVFAVGALTSRFDPHAASRRSPLLLLAAMVTALFVGLRYEVGGDWFNYVDIFRATYSRLSDALGQADPGYMFLNWLGRRLGLDMWFVNFCCGLIFVGGLVQFTRREPNPWLSLLVAVPYLMIVVGMGYTRQAVAISLLMMALAALFEERYLRVAIFAVLAALFHRTAIIILPLLALSVVRHRTVIWAAMALISIWLFDFLVSQILDRLRASYLESSMGSDGAEIRVAMNVLPAVIFLCASRRFSRTEQERNLWRNFSLAALASLAALFLISSSTVVDRLALYLIPLQLVVLGRLPYVFPRNGLPNAQLILAVVIYSAAIQFVWLNFATHAEAWLPYQLMSPW